MNIKQGFGQFRKKDDRVRLEQEYLNYSQKLTFEGERLKRGYLELIN